MQPLCSLIQCLASTSAVAATGSVTLAPAAAAIATNPLSFAQPPAAATSSLNDMTFNVPGHAAATSTPAIVQKSKPATLFGGGGAVGDPPATKPPISNLFGSAPSGGLQPQPPPAFGAQPGATKPPPTFGGFGAPAGGVTLTFNAAPQFGLGLGGLAPAAAVAAPSQSAPAPIAQPPLPKPANASAAGGNQQHQPFLTVSGSYAAPKPTHATSAPSASQPSTPNGTESGAGGDADDKVLRRMIADEIAAFEADLQRQLGASRSVRLELGDRAELADTAQRLAQLHDIGAEATESTHQLQLEVQSLRLALNETFAMLTEAQTKRQMFGTME